jgi:hypothetical protein
MDQLRQSGSEGYIENRTLHKNGEMNETGYGFGNAGRNSLVWESAVDSTVEVAILPAEWLSLRPISLLYLAPFQVRPVRARM